MKVPPVAMIYYTSDVFKRESIFLATPPCFGLRGIELGRVERGKRAFILGAMPTVQEGAQNM